ncbi:MAG: DUF1573 domain-containing protein [Chthoniobacterales bacterium]
MKTGMFICAFSVSLCAAAYGELKWEQTTADLHPALGDKRAIAHFRYQNVGTTTVRLKSVKPSCGCTSVQTHADHVAPGETGEITASFHIGDRTGIQIKTVKVQTDDSDSASATTVLTLKATIPQLLEVQPTFVHWESGEAPKPKIITVMLTKDFPVKSIKAISSNLAFQANVKKVGEGKFQIEIQPPAATAEKSSAIITIQSDNASRNYYATALVAGAASSNPESGAR